MSTFTQIVQEKAKAFLAGGTVLIAGIAEWAVQDSAIAGTIQHVIPAPWNLLVPGILAATGTWLVHHVPNASPTQVTFQEPSTATQLQAVITAGGGEFTGTAAH